MGGRASNHVWRGKGKGKRVDTYERMHPFAGSLPRSGSDTIHVDSAPAHRRLHADGTFNVWYVRAGMCACACVCVFPRACPYVCVCLVYVCACATCRMARARVRIALACAVLDASVHEPEYALTKLISMMFILIFVFLSSLLVCTSVCLRKLASRLCKFAIHTHTHTHTHTRTRTGNSLQDFASLSSCFVTVFEMLVGAGDYYEV
jgi:hypothetical protein